MPYTQEQYQRAKEAVSSGKIPQDKVPVVQSRIAEFENDQARGYMRAPSEEAPGTVLATGSKGKPNAQGYDIDLSRPDAVVLQPGETAGSLRLQALRKQFEDRKLPNASKLKVYSDPPEYEPPPKPVSPFSPLSAQAYLGTDDATHKKYFHEPTVAEFRNDVAKSPELQARLAKDFPHISDKLKSKVDDNQLTSSDTFLAYQDSRWRLAYADAVKRGQPLYRLAYTKAIPDSEKAAAERADMANAVVGGAGQGATLGLLNPLQQAINPRMAEENRAERQRNPGSAFAGDVVGSMAGAPRLIFGGLSSLSPVKKLGEVGKYLPGAVAGAGTGLIDDSARQVGESVAESLDAHDAALEALARIHDRFDPMRTATAGLLGGGLAAAGEGMSDLAHRAGRGIVSSGERAPVIERNLKSGGKMSLSGNVRLEPELEAAGLQAARAGTTAEQALADKMVDPILKSQLQAQENAISTAKAETEAARQALQRPEVVNGSMSMAPTEVPTGPTAKRIASIADEMPSLRNEDTAKQRALKSFAERFNTGKVDAKGLDLAIESADNAAKNTNINGKVDETWQAVSRALRDLRDELNFGPGDATVVDRPKFAVRDSEGNNKVVGDYSGAKIRQKKALTQLEFENEALGIPNPGRGLRSEPVELPKAPGGDEYQALAEGAGPEVQAGPNTRANVANSLKRAAQVSAPNPQLEKILRVGKRAGIDIDRGLEILRKIQDRGDYRKLLSQATSGLTVGPGGLGNKFLSQNQLLRLVPSLKGLAGGRPTPPTVEPTGMLDQVFEELLRGKTVNNSEVLGSATKNLGDEVMDKFVPELGGGILKLGGSKFPSSAASVTKRGKEESFLQKLTPQEQKLLVEIIGNLAEMNPETP